MAKSPPLDSPLSRLESFKPQYLTERYVAWLNDPEVVRYSEHRHQRHDLASCQHYVASFDGTPNYLWAIIARDDNLGHIGNINAYIDAANGVADIGIMIGEKGTWGRGYGVDAWKAVCRYLFLSMGIRKVTAGTIVTNRSMIGIMKKTGMRFDGQRARHLILDGKEVDLQYAALFCEDFVA